MNLTHSRSDLVIDVEPSDEAPYRSQGWGEHVVEQPARNATVEAWRAYAEYMGLEGDISTMTRAELIDALT